MGRSNNNDDIDDTDGIGIEGDVLDDIASAPAAEVVASTREDSPETRSVSSRCRIREQLQDDIAAFLARGGHIDHVDPRAMAERHDRSGDDYGSRLI